MSFVRATLLARQRASTSLILQRRPSSSSSHAEHHEEQHDTTEYPRESEDASSPCFGFILSSTPGFFNSFWLKTILLTGVGLAAYEAQPELKEGDEHFITQWIREGTEVAETWTHRNLANTIQAADAAETKVFLSNAQKPPIYRTRYPQ